MKIKLRTLILYIYLIKTISITVYQCSNMDFNTEQCMLNYTDKNGDTHILLKICPENKLCQPIRDYSMGFCVFNAKELPPKSECYYSAQCSTRICEGEDVGICIGYDEFKYCNPDKIECNHNMTCRKTIEENRYVYKCLNISFFGEQCENDNDCGMNLVCAYYSNISDIINNNNINLNNIKNYLNSSDYLNLTQNKFCIERASLENGIITNEEKACKSGQLIPIELNQEKKEIICGSKTKIIKDCDKNYKCIIEVDIGLDKNIEMEEECLFSSIGNLICPLDQKEKAWKNYLEVYDKILEKSSDIEESIHVPYDKYSLRNGDVFQAYWEYFDWIHAIEGDECAKNYFFVKNKTNFIFYNIYYLLGLILLLYV